MPRYCLWFFLVVVLISLIGCGDAKIAAGGDDDVIIVFADSLAWNALSTTLRGVFEDTVYTPQPETWLRLQRVPFEEFGRYEKHKNRLLVALLDSPGPVSSYVGSSLEQSVRTLVEERREYVFTKYDSKARGQILMYLTGPDLASLRASIENGEANLIYFFKNMALKRELAALTSEKKYEKTEISERLAKHYGWSITVPHDYWVATDSASAKFFWMRRANPTDMERWIFVHWTEKASPAMLTNSFVLQRRDSLTKMFYRTVNDDAYVEIAPYHLQIESVDFLGKFAYETRGVWRFNDKSGGGPFVNYTFYDDSTRRMYMIDGSIFAPRVEKKKLILQVDGILHTFEPSTLPSTAQTAQQSTTK